MKNIFLIIIISSFIGFAQTFQKETKSGAVSFISSQYVYVKFENTDGISEGDTLFFQSKDQNIPALKVKFISTNSLACENISNRNFSVNEKLLAFTKVKNEVQEFVENDETETLNITESPSSKTINDQHKKTEAPSAIISGRISSQSYSNFSNYHNKGNYQRWRHSLKFSVTDVKGSGLSFSTYSVFAYRADDWNRISSNIGNALKVYDLKIGYDFNESSRIRLGRFLNRRISSIGPVDGLQFETDFSSYSLGLVAGSRPHFSDFGYNSKLFEYGVYFSKADNFGNGTMENTISVFEQTNDFKTDRRFIYFQHTNNIMSKTSLFVSSEIDLYKKILSNKENTVTLTSLFISARYAPIREISFSASYDARKNVVYYETFKSFIDSLFENETRKGFKFRTNIRPLKYFSLGMNYGYRFRKADPNPNTNYGGFLNYSSIPFLGFSSTLSYNRLNSSYFEGNIAEISLSKYIDEIKSDIHLGFRYTEYSLLPDRGKFAEKSILIDFSSRILFPVHLSFGYEGIFENRFTSGRILMDASLRF